MTQYIRCPECSFCIGKYMDFFDKAKTSIIDNHRKKEKNIFEPEKIMLKPNIVPTMENLFDSLNIKNRCCRMHMLCKAEFDKKYK